MFAGKGENYDRVSGLLDFISIKHVYSCLFAFNKTKDKVLLFKYVNKLRLIRIIPVNEQFVSVLFFQIKAHNIHCIRL